MEIKMEFEEWSAPHSMGYRCAECERAMEWGEPTILRLLVEEEGGAVEVKPYCPQCWSR